ncbi:hypothetical protein B046DRAFT_04356 [Streptomyces sp. LamerLS-316]|nr:hypothetical protein B046DRAFT_04356 [Streptomyces sp. LamerLS-316]
MGPVGRREARRLTGPVRVGPRVGGPCGYGSIQESTGVDWR